VDSYRLACDLPPVFGPVDLTPHLWTGLLGA
jgi:hypothetical protein